jgi:gliding motility-associated-like protein
VGTAIFFVQAFGRASSRDVVSAHTSFVINSFRVKGNYEETLLKKIICAVFVLLKISGFTQLVSVGNDKVILTSGVQVISNGGVQIEGGILINHGFFQITKFCTSSNPGNLKIFNTSSVSGNGFYKIEQDWINNGNYACDNSIVELYGDTKQLITSDNATNTIYHTLILTGNGTNENRKKELVSIDASTNITGTLILNDRELSTLTNSFFVINPNLNSIQFDATFQDEGMVSSLNPGYLYRATNQTNVYVFPLGSSNGIRRFRPIAISPLASNQNNFRARLNNFDSNVDSFDRNLTDDQSKDLNPNFYHSINCPEGLNSNATIEIGYLFSDGIFDGISNWDLSLYQWNSLKNEAASNLGNYNSLKSTSINLHSLFHPFILSNNDITADVYVPNSFTPDGEEFNNVFSPVFSNYELIDDIQFYIFDRWGELIFEGYGPNVYWDGYLGEYRCQDGVYTWKLNFYKSGKLNQLVGHVNLLK